jgi:hypothetical protein
MKRLQDDLAACQRRWNLHRVSTANSKSPLRMVALNAASNKAIVVHGDQGIYDETYDDFDPREGARMTSNDVARTVVCHLQPHQLAFFRSSVEPITLM